jgi:hypothetical protein
MRSLRAPNSETLIRLEGIPVGFVVETVTLRLAHFQSPPLLPFIVIPRMLHTHILLLPSVQYSLSKCLRL